jgi:hypothetical protein
LARKSPKPEPQSEEILDCVQRSCPECGSLMRNDYNNLRHVRTLGGVVQLRLKIRRCNNTSCERYRIAYRPEKEGSWILPHHEFGLDVLETGIDNFIKTTRSYWSGLFHCYEIEDFPRTNNDLEHAFGLLRHHQRRCTGRKVAPSSLVIRGSVKLASAIATKLRSFTAEDFAQVDIDTWLELRSHLKTHHQKRVEQYRFRRDPNAYLANLESQLL